MLSLLGLLVFSGSAGSQTPGDPSVQGLDLRAHVVAPRKTVLSSEVPGRIERMPLGEADRFEAGDVLFSIDCALRVVQLDKALAQQGLAEQRLASQERLLSLNAIGTLDVAATEAELAIATADAQALQTTLERCTVRAPFAGVIETRHADAHQYINAGQPVLDILDDSNLQIEFFMPSDWLLWLQPDHRLWVHIDDTDRTYALALVRTAVRVDPLSQTIAAVARLLEEHPELRPGMSGRLIRVEEP